MTIDQVRGPGGQKAKDVKSLSGGEKSFTQICLLLTLWECTGCPLRCLDEFYVYLDVPNRAVCLNMLANAARSSEGKQHFFIIPKEAEEYLRPDPPLVKMVRLRDPARTG